VESFSLAGILGFVVLTSSSKYAEQLHPIIENYHQRLTSSQHQEHPGAKLYYVHENFFNIATQIETNNTWLQEYLCKIISQICLCARRKTNQQWQDFYLLHKCG